MRFDQYAGYSVIMHCFELPASLWFSFTNSDSSRNPICFDVSQIQLDSCSNFWLTVMTSLTCCISIVVSSPCRSSIFLAYRGSAFVKTMPSSLFPLVCIRLPRSHTQLSLPNGFLCMRVVLIRIQNRNRNRNRVCTSHIQCDWLMLLLLLRK